MALCEGDCSERLARLRSAWERQQVHVAKWLRVDAPADPEALREDFPGRGDAFAPARAIRAWLDALAEALRPLVTSAAWRRATAHWAAPPAGAYGGRAAEADTLRELARAEKLEDARERPPQRGRTARRLIPSPCPRGKREILRDEGILYRYLELHSEAVVRLPAWQHDLELQLTAQGCPAPPQDLAVRFAGAACTLERMGLVKLRDATALKTHWGHDWAVVNTNWQSIEEEKEEEEGRDEDSPQPIQDLLSQAAPAAAAQSPKRSPFKLLRKGEKRQSGDKQTPPAKRRRPAKGGGVLRFPKGM